MRFREMRCSYPPNLTPDAWNEILLKMAEAFKLIITSDTKIMTDEENKLIDDGLDLFREYYFDLWD
jgi:nitrogenase molybdenum-iron protein alpha/beta subunit